MLPNPLFHYTRTKTPLTVVHVQVHQPAFYSLSPFLFGNFLEDLGSVIERGLLADALLNPSLEAETPTNTAPPFWALQGNASWIEPGYFSPHAVALSQPTSTLSAGQLEQTVYLPLKRVRTYLFSGLFLTLEGTGVVEVQIASEDGKLLAQHTLRVTGTEWQPLSALLEVQGTSPQPGTPYRFSLVFREGSPVVVDRLSLLPTDNVDGLDPEVLALAKAWKMPIIRYPGGNFASGYHWEDGVGNPNKRPSGRNPAWGGIQSNRFGTDEFLRFCRLVHTQPQITLNAGDGTPEEAAAWVAYCNAASNASPYARLRAENGHPAPYHVRIWEIGNELYGSWQIGHTDAEGNAERFVRFRDAVLKVAPHIQLIATGKGDEYTPDGIERDMDWNRALLRTSLEKANHPPDYLSLHPLLPLPEAVGPLPYAEQYQAAMAFPFFLDRELFPDIEQLIQEIEGPHPITHLAVTEWGIIIGGQGWEQSPNHNTLAGAIFNALMLNAMIRHGNTIRIANMTGFMHGGGIKKQDGVVYVDPQYYTQKLYVEAHPHTPLAVHLEGPGQDVPARGRLAAVANVPDVDACAALSTDGKTLVLFLVNHLLQGERTVSLDVRGFSFQKATATILTAPLATAHNGIEHPNAVRPQPFPLPSGFGQHPQPLTLPAHALVVLKLSP